MGDFWHMGLEETSFIGAFISGRPAHALHIAGLKQRIIPGVFPEELVDGFKGLKLIGSAAL